MNRIFAACSAMALAVAATPAAAQLAGQYNGTSADGQTVQFTVATNTVTNELSVTSALIFFTAPCKGAVATLNSGLGYGPNADIENGKVHSVATFPSNYVTFNLTFSADGQSATGTVLSIAGDLYPAGVKPRKALICTSPTQAMTVTLQPPAAKAQAHTPRAFVY